MQKYPHNPASKSSHIENSPVIPPRNISINRPVIGAFLLLILVSEVTAQCVKQQSSCPQPKKVTPTIYDEVNVILSLVMLVLGMALLGYKTRELYNDWKKSKALQANVDGHIQFIKHILGNFFEITTVKQNGQEIKISINWHANNAVVHYINARIPTYQLTNKQSVVNRLLDTVKKHFANDKIVLTEQEFKITFTNKSVKSKPQTAASLNTAEMIAEILDEPVIIPELNRRMKLLQEQAKLLQEQVKRQRREVEERRACTIESIKVHYAETQQLSKNVADFAKKSEGDLSDRLTDLNNAENRKYAQVKLGDGARQIVQLKLDIENGIEKSTKLHKEIEEQLKVFKKDLGSTDNFSDDQCLQLISKIATVNAGYKNTITELTELQRQDVAKLDASIKTFNRIRNHDGKDDEVDAQEQVESIPIPESPPKSLEMTGSAKSATSAPISVPAPTPVSVPSSKPTPLKTDLPFSAGHGKAERQSRVFYSHTNTRPLSNDDKTTYNKPPAAMTKSPSFFKPAQEPSKLPSAELLKIAKKYFDEIKYMVGNLSYYKRADADLKLMFTQALTYNILRMCHTLWLFGMREKENNLADTNQVRLLRHMLVHLLYMSTEDEIIQLAETIKTQSSECFFNEDSSTKATKLDFSTTSFYRRAKQQWDVSREMKSSKICIDQILQALRQIETLNKLAIIAPAIDEQQYKSNAYKMLLLHIGEHVEILRRDFPHIWDSFEKAHVADVLGKTVRFRSYLS